MDNRIFNVNGSGLIMLEKTLELAFLQHGENTKATAWIFDPLHGFIILWTRKEGAHTLPVPLAASEIAPMVAAWLNGEQAKSMPDPVGWDADSDHDGSNSKGWRVSCGDWGHVGGAWQALCSIRPVFLWHGK